MNPDKKDKPLINVSVQLNHPGKQKRFSLKNGYSEDIKDRIVRNWNDDKTHYRKFIENPGWYLSDFGKDKFSNSLLFWGEWEGPSYYENFKNKSKLSPNGLHKPFYSEENKGRQNTDPFVYGENFYYAVCKQRGRMSNLLEDSLILFGSAYKEHFVLDTVFVVKSSKLAQNVIENIKSYSSIYQSVTINQIKNTYNSKNSINRLYSSKTWYDNPEFFSFIPCRLKDGKNEFGFERLKIKYNRILNNLCFSDNPMAVKYFSKGNEKTTKLLWDFILNSAINQGFKIGVKFKEPNK